ncbi:xanthine dehydrogenase family protein molybdopterin-binding subunit [Chondromyces apiculatus]|uniref:Isoquinoline 1-oxidoreductase beta subunit n=1 Tax=Chondromyces apiculatus DSM 436 TaxID=1192034 RepID=A0A017T344_9BACT|nr:molybdopterin cofactor-binding domain-containing protein [Chondromyces apiculatus]EYF03417.1 Isoquinoline 1-oxidoreductase beta subunit [Chondromyces apiculatus DSM 436]
MVARVADVSMRRRSFLQGLGLVAGGLTLGLLDEAEALAAPPAKAGAKAAGAPEGLSPNPFVHVSPAGEVVVVCQRSEMGQGVRSSLHVVIADELGADLARVRVVQAEGDKKYGDQNTDGSRSVRNDWVKLRQMGAMARTQLVAVAATRWRVPATECVARDHAVWHDRSKRTLGFGELAVDAGKLRVPDVKKIQLRPRSELRHVGTELPLRDGPDIVTGRGQFGADVKLPGMLVAVVERPPVVGGKVATFDATKALAVKGVRKVVELPTPQGAPAFQPRGGVAVIADHTWAAMRGRAALSITWDHGPNEIYDSDAYREQILSSVRAPGQVMRKVGDVDKAFAEAARTLEAEYYLPHLAHAAMEPPAALASFKDGACEVWATTQNPQAARTEVARALGIGEDKVKVNVTLVGGGFGRKSKADFVSEAALLSREAQAPVRVQWTREDDIRHDYFHTVSAQSLKVALDKDGKVTAWRHRTAFPPIPSTFDATQKRPSEGELGQGVLDLPLAIPNVQAEAGEAPAHVRIGWLRSVCNIFHGFAIGTFVDEVAHARGQDPRATWLDILGPARNLTPEEAGVKKIPNYGTPIADHPVEVGGLRNVIEKVTELSGWEAKRKAGQALGLSAHRSFLTSVAVVASAKRGKDGKPVIDEVWIVADAGLIVNAERVRSQLEGAVIFGMSVLFHGAITMRKGAVEQTNFRDYPVMRIGEAPRRIHVHVVPSEARPGGVGEPGVPPVAPAIANALFALDGTRHRQLPLSAKRPG